MWKIAADTQSAHRALFAHCYHNCQALRDIIAYSDDENNKIAWRSNPSIAAVVVTAIEMPEFRNELKRWREVNTPIWEQLEKNGRIVYANEREQNRTIGELTETYGTTNTMISSLQSRLFAVLLREHQQTSVQ